MKLLLQISFAALCFLFSSCAASFHSINPKKVPFSYIENTPDIQFSYAYDVLSINRNKKYAKKESKHGMRVVAVRITNNSEKPLRLNDNLKLLVGNHQTVPIDPAIVTKNIKQRTWLYLLYTPLTLTINASSTQNSYGQTESAGGTTLPIGPFIASANAFMAHMANKIFFKELHENNLLTKTIEPGQTVYGLVSVHSLTADPIKFEVH